MGQLVDTLGNKSDGQLVRAQDWDALVAAVETGDEQLAQEIVAGDKLVTAAMEAADKTLKDGYEAGDQTLKTALEAGDKALGDRLDTLTARVDGVDQRLHDIDARIDALPLGSCTVHAGPGDDLEQKVGRLPATGGELCLAAGTYELAAPLTVTGRRRIVITGAGFATVIRATASEAALVFTSCAEIELRGLRVEGGPPSGASRASDEHLNGAVTFEGAADIVVTECTFVCRSDTSRRQACLTVRTPAGDVRIERSRFEIGAHQIGMLVVDAQAVTIAHNRVRLDPAARTPIGRPLPESLRPLPGVPRPGPIRPIIPRAPEAFAEQGIVVGGAGAGTVQILDNLVQDVAQGIHVGVSREALRGAPAVLADRVVIARNIVRLYVPGDYNRDRHAVFVGNARSIQVLDTTADVRRNVVLRPTPIEGIRVHGTFGPYVAVRGSSLKAFGVGVRVVPLQPVADALWVVSDTQAEGAANAVDAPESVDQTGRNRPAPPPVPVPGRPTAISLEPAVAVVAHGAPHRLVAIVRDAAGLNVPAARVRFALSRKNAPDAVPLEVLTDASGRAELTYAGLNAGQDAITAFVDINGNGKQDLGEPFASATVTFLASQPESIAFAAPSVAATTGSPVTLTAVVRDASQRPLADVTVAFAVAGKNQAGAQAKTDAQGAATLTYKGEIAGTDLVTATVARQDGGQLKATAAVTYLPPAPARVVLDVPSSAAAGDGVTARVTVLSQAQTPVPGVTLWFAVSGANRMSGPLSTDAQGQTGFFYTPANPGNDTVLVFVAKNPADPSARASDAPFAVAAINVVVRQAERELVPDLMGMTRDQAAEAVVARRLQLGKVRILPDPPFAGGTPVVVGQDPAPPAQVAPGTLVYITLQRRGRFALESSEEAPRIRRVDFPV